MLSLGQHQKSFDGEMRILFSVFHCSLWRYFPVVFNVFQGGSNLEWRPDICLSYVLYLFGCQSTSFIYFHI